MSTAKPNVILIAYYFPPAPEIGGFRPFRFYKYLKRLGYACQVITASKPNQNLDDVLFVPDDLHRIWENDEPQRLPLKARQELMLRKLMFPGHVGIMWSIDVAAQCREILRKQPQEKFVLLSTFPPLGVLLAGLLVHRREKIPWIADFRDPFGGVGKGFVPGYAHFWHRRVEALVLRNVSAVIANAEQAAEIWQERYPQTREKLRVICNGFDPEDAPVARELPSRCEKVILHAGALYHGRNPNVLIKSFSRLRQSGAPEVSAVKILLLGAIDAYAGLDAAIYAEGKRDGWLIIQPPVPKEESQQMMEEADGLLLIQPQSKTQIPGKLFEYICVGRPILALVPQRSAAESVLERAGVPYMCIYVDDDDETVDRKMLEFLRLPTLPTQYSSWFRDNFNAEHQAEQLADIIAKVQ